MSGRYRVIRAGDSVTDTLAILHRHCLQAAPEVEALVNGVSGTVGGQDKAAATADHDIQQDHKRDGGANDDVTDNDGKEGTKRPRVDRV